MSLEDVYKRQKYYSKGDLVTTLTTGKDGKATAKNPVSYTHITKMSGKL